MIHSRLFQSAQRSETRDPVSLDDGLRMNFLADEPLGFSEQLRRQNADRCRSIPDFVILHLGDVYKDFGGGIVKLDGL